MFAAQRKDRIVTDNVMPELNVLAIEPAGQRSGRFHRRIVHAKGIDPPREFMRCSAHTGGGARARVSSRMPRRHRDGTVLVVAPGCDDRRSLDRARRAGAGVPQGLPSANQRTSKAISACATTRPLVEAWARSHRHLRGSRPSACASSYVIAADAGHLPDSDDELALDQASRAQPSGLRSRAMRNVETAYTVRARTVQHGKICRVSMQHGTGGAIVASATRLVLSTALAIPRVVVAQAKQPRLLLDAHTCFMLRTARGGRAARGTRARARQSAAAR